MNSLYFWASNILLQTFRYQKSYLFVCIYLFVGKYDIFLKRLESAFKEFRKINNPLFIDCQQFQKNYNIIFANKEVTLNIFLNLFKLLQFFLKKITVFPSAPS